MTLIRRGFFGRRKRLAPKGGNQVEQKYDPKRIPELYRQRG
ncbi:hypothetical protein KKC1_16160 [Calderihabitans maritimus]|uniref:Uncharacterized protein n=1 Tax=Calderihabitans maritimus TaxID=1246530 RepID=A0A1Z5HSG7_9FIRM|nr:hypothetical protein KKC1_16160 [Calderihabitans maritimus]